jgi:hypothetical protein
MRLQAVDNSMYEKCLRHDGHTRRFAIAENGGAWEVRTEEDSQLVRKVRYDDWHRVERALQTIRLEIMTLQDAGWVVV